METPMPTIAEKIAELLEGKKAKDITTINVEDVCSFTDHFVICTGTSSTHIKALCDEVNTQLREQGTNPIFIGGYATANWVLLDYTSVIVHIFNSETRDFYNIERLWSDGVVKRLNRSDMLCSETIEENYAFMK